MTSIHKAFILIAAISLFSCGIKGPPLPPIEEETVQKQMAAESQPTTPASTDTTKSSVKEKNKK